MDAIAYMDECKEKLGITSNYALHKATGITEARISDYYKGKCIPDEFACFKFAEILEMSPVIVIAEIQMTNTKKPDKALFFKHFLTTVGLWIIIAVIPVNLGTFSNNAYAAGTHAGSDISAHYTKWINYLLKFILLTFERYFTCNWSRKPLRG